MNEIEKIGTGAVVERISKSPEMAMIEMIERVAMNPDVDITKMQAVLDMRTAMMDRDAEIAFNAALADAQSVMRPVVKDASNEQTHSRYARLEAIARSIDPIISAHGFSRSFGQADCPTSDHYRVTMELAHRAGFRKRYQIDVPIDATGMAGKVNKTKTHALGSTLSYGRRYLKLMAFDIATGDDDDGQAAGQSITAEQYQRLVGLLEQAGADTDAQQKFTRWCKVDNLEELPLAGYGRAEAALLQKIAQKEATDA